MRVSGRVAIIVPGSIDHYFKSWVDDRARLLRIEVLLELGRALDVSEERSDRLALALKIFRGGRFCQANLSLVGFLSRNSCRGVLRALRHIGRRI